MRRKSAAAFCFVTAMLGATPVLAEQPSSLPAAIDSVRSNERPTPNAEAQTTPRGSSPVAPKPASSADRQSYATREAASPDAKNYKGGDAVVVIGASTATVILAVVLLIVLL